MNDVRDWLKDADPVANEPPLSDADVQRMRRAVVTASEPSPSFADWARGSWAAATVAIALMIAVGMNRWITPASNVEINRDVAPAVASDNVTRRQMQLIAPGGTRVIWVFNDEFKP
jgi:hypothetical protein